MSNEDLLRLSANDTARQNQTELGVLSLRGMPDDRKDRHAGEYA